MMVLYSAGTCFCVLPSSQFGVIDPIIDVATLCSYNWHVFTWDESKRRINLAKVGIDFLDAGRIFDGPLVTVEDSRENYGEPR